MSQDPSIADLREAGALTPLGRALPSPGWRRRRREAGQVGGAEGAQRGRGDLHLSQRCPSTAVSPEAPAGRSSWRQRGGSRQEAGGQLCPGKWALHTGLPTWGRGRAPMKTPEWSLKRPLKKGQAEGMRFARDIPSSQSRPRVYGPPSRHWRRGVQWSVRVLLPWLWFSRLGVA